MATMVWRRKSLRMVFESGCSERVGDVDDVAGRTERGRSSRIEGSSERSKRRCGLLEVDGDIGAMAEARRLYLFASR